MEQKFAKGLKTSSGVNEYLTPESAVYPVLPYAAGKRVWCPFDTAKSAFVKVLQENHISVIHTHIAEGKDFFSYEPKEAYDCIISNPPFSQRDKVLERLFALRRPFMMLMNASGIFDSRFRFNLFRQFGVELLILQGRTAFTRASDGKTASPMFQSWYICHAILPKEIVFA